MVDLPAALVRLGLVVALLAALLWIPVSGNIPGRAALAPALVFLALIVTMAATTVTMYRTPPGENVTCANGRTSLCVWPEHEKYLPMLGAVNARVDTLPAALRLPPRIVEFGIDRNWHMENGPHGPIMHEDRIGEPSFSILEGSIWSSAGSISTGIMSATFEFTNMKCRWASRTDADNARLLALGAWRESYLVGGGNPDYHTNAPQEMQDAWTIGRGMARKASRAEQFSWVDGRCTTSMAVTASAETAVSSTSAPGRAFLAARRATSVLSATVITGALTAWLGLYQASLPAAFQTGRSTIPIWRLLALGAAVVPVVALHSRLADLELVATRRFRHYQRIYLGGMSLGCAAIHLGISAIYVTSAGLGDRRPVLARLVWTGADRRGVHRLAAGSGATGDHGKHSLSLG